MNRLSQRIFNAQRSRKSNLGRRQRRRLLGEALEGRQLLASDVASPVQVPTEGLNPHHNYLIETDTNRDFRTTPLDALIVLNKLGQSSSLSLATGEFASTNTDNLYLDVNNDGQLTPLDALTVLNRLSSGEAEGELIQLKLGVSKENADGTEEELLSDANRNFQLFVGDKFQLEVQYSDLRSSANRFGAFAIYSDIIASSNGAIAPVIGEIQLLSISPNFVDASGGDIKLTMGAQTALVPFSTADINEPSLEFNPLSAIRAAVNSFGFSDVNVELADQPDEADPTKPYVFSISFKGDSEEFQDVPNIVATSQLTGVNATATITEIPVYINHDPAQGLNPSAFLGSVDFRSSNFNDDLLYTLLQSGTYSPQSEGDGVPNVVFDDVGGLFFYAGSNGLKGYAQANNIPYNGLNIEAFSIELQVVAPSNGPIEFKLDLPDNTGHEILLFGEGQELDPSLIKIDTTLGTGTGLAYGTFLDKPEDITIGADSRTTPEDTALTFNPVANDTDNTDGILTITGTTNGTNGTVTFSGNNVTYLPNTNYFTTTTPDTFTYTVTSSNGAVATGTVTVSVTPVNDPPVAVNDSGTLNGFNLTTPEDTPLTIPSSRLTANDSAGPSNESGQTLTIVSVSPGSTRGGTVSLNSTTGDILYTPKVGEIGNDTFTYTVSDGTATASATVTIVVTDVNTGPTAVNDTITAVEDTTLTLPLSDLTANDTDDSNPVSVTVTSVTGANVVISGTNFVYTPPANVFGNAADSFTYTIRDAGGLTSTATVTVNITPVNDPPEANNDTFSVDEGSTDNSLDVLDNDTAGPNETGALTLVSVTGGQGTVSVSSDSKMVLYTPPSATFLGTDSFTYTVQDSAGATSSATVTVNVVPTVRPRAVNDRVTYAEDSGVHTINVLANDLANAGASVTLESFDTSAFNSASGTLTLSDNGTPTIKTDDYFVFTPAANYFGATSFTYTISDTSGNDSEAIAAGVNQATVFITVTSVNDPPVFNPDPVYSTPEDTPLTLGPGGNVNPLDNDSAGPSNENQTLSISAVANSSANGGTLSLTNGIITYTPAANFFGSDSFTYTITDGIDSVSAVANISVVAVNDPPTANDITFSIKGQNPVTFTKAELLAGASAGPNESGQTLTITSVSAASKGGTVVLNSDQSITYTPPATLSGLDSFTITIADNGNPSLSTTAVISISNNSSPIGGPDYFGVYKGQELLITPSQLLTNDSDPEGDALSITAVSNMTVGSATLNADGSVTVFIPADTTASIATFEYTLSDGSSTTQVTVTLDIGSFQPSTISGQLFFDQMVNGQRNGIYDDGEIALSGVSVRLYDIVNEVTVATVLTDAQGNFTFTNVAPGDYSCQIDMPGGVVGLADTATSIDVYIPNEGGANVSGISFTMGAYAGSQASMLDRFTPSYLLAQAYARGVSVTSSEIAALAAQGVMASISADGTLEYIEVKDGFSDAEFVEVSLNASHDSLLLSKVYDDGSVKTARLDRGDFIVMDNGRGGSIVRIFGSNFDFQDASSFASSASDYQSYMDAVDQVLASM